MTCVPVCCLNTAIDGAYLIEVDRVLRPGGYWILSGPPINWKKHWKGWERTREDLNAEQNRIEKVAKSLCWTKLIEKDDIAIWQKPKNHLNCKLNRKLTQTPPFCPAQDPDKAWYEPVNFFVGFPSFIYHGVYSLTTYRITSR